MLQCESECTMSSYLVHVWHVMNNAFSRHSRHTLISAAFKMVLVENMAICIVLSVGALVRRKCKANKQTHLIGALK